MIGPLQEAEAILQQAISAQDSQSRVQYKGVLALLKHRYAEAVQNNRPQNYARCVAAVPDPCPTHQPQPTLRVAVFPRATQSLFDRRHRSCVSGLCCRWTTGEQSCYHAMVEKLNEARGSEEILRCVT